MNSKAKLTIVAALCIFVALGTSLFRQNEWEDIARRSLSADNAAEGEETEHTVKKYTIDDIATTMPYYKPSHPQLLVWDGQSFSTYNLIHKLSKEDEFVSFRYNNLIPLAVHALSTEFPDRFQRGTPPFQIMWTVEDYIGGKCINEREHCPSDTFAPILVFGSVPRNKELLPTAKAFPNPYFANCLYHWQIKGVNTCKWTAVNEDVPFDDLKKQVFWRGSDFSNFLHDYKKEYQNKEGLRSLFRPSVMRELDKESIVKRIYENILNIPPRWIAIAFTLTARMNHPTSDNNWIDILFSNQGVMNKDLHKSFEDKGLQVTDNPMGPHEMSSKYAYQIDLGGGGGTTWDGTITKLLMKGILFHHETVFQDWFYDDMKPWVHYLPVTWNLSNLWLQYRWAEEHPIEVQEISAEATKFAKYLLSEEYMSKLWKELYVDYLGQQIEAFDDQGMDWDTMVKHYESKEITLQKISTCDHRTCNTKVGEDWFIDWLPHKADDAAATS